MGEARRRRLAEERHAKADPVRYSEPWPCAECSDPDLIAEGGDDSVVYEVRGGIAWCPRCGRGEKLERFGFKLQPVAVEEDE